MLDIVGELGGEGVTLQQILSAKHGAKDRQIKLAVRGLVSVGHLVATGATRNRQFSLPVKRKAS